VTKGIIGGLTGCKSSKLCINFLNDLISAGFAPDQTPRGGVLKKKIKYLLQRFKTFLGKPYINIAFTSNKIKYK